MTKVLLDANVYFAGFVSKSGALNLILDLVAHRRLSAFATSLILREVDRNLRRKANPEALSDFHQFLHKAQIQMIPSPGEQILKECEPYIHPKDVPVLAAARIARVDYLVTLDRRHFFARGVSVAARTMTIITPGDFIHRWLKSGKQE